VRAADEFAVDVELRNGRPVRVLLDAFADRLVGEHVDAGELVHAAGIEHLHREGREAALRKLRRALHEQHDAIAGDLILDALLSIHGIHFIAFRRSPAVFQPDRASLRWFHAPPPPAARAPHPAARPHAPSVASRPEAGAQAPRAPARETHPARPRPRAARCGARTAARPGGGHPPARTADWR